MDIKEKWRDKRSQRGFIMLIYLIVICRHESIPTSKDLSSFLLSLHLPTSIPCMLFSTAGVLLVKGVLFPTKAHIAIAVSPECSKYKKVSDVVESRVWFASKNLTPRRKNALLIAKIDHELIARIDA